MPEEDDHEQPIWIKFVDIMNRIHYDNRLFQMNQIVFDISITFVEQMAMHFQR